MTGYIVKTETVGECAGMIAGQASFGTSGPLTIEGLRSAPTTEDPRFVVRAVTLSNGAFKTHQDGNLK